MQNEQPSSSLDRGTTIDLGAAPPTYFTVGAMKLSLMALTTFGLYELYWFYRNWQIIRDRGHPRIAPFWRAFFAPLWTFSFGTHLKAEAKARGIHVILPVIILGVSYLALSILWRLPDPY